MNAEPANPAVTTSTKAITSRLDLWLSKLPKQSMALNATVARAVKQALLDPDCTAETLAQRIQQDPVLCLKLYLYAQNRLQDRQGDIQGLVHLIGLLGFDNIEQIVNKAAKLKQAHRGQREWFAISLFAAYLASHLLPEKHGTRGERFFLPSLFVHAPLWLMWSAAPKLVNYGQTMASQKHKPLKPLCRQHLGFLLPELLQQTSNFWALPDITLKTLALDPSTDLKFWASIKRQSTENLPVWLEQHKAAKQRFYAVETGLYLINQYATAIYLDYQGKHCQRWATLLSRHLNISAEQLDELVSDSATQMPLPSYMKGDMAPLYRYRGLHYAITDDADQPALARIKQHLKPLQQSRSVSNSLSLAMEALAAGVEVEHGLILTLTQDQLKVSRSVGFDSPALKHLQIARQECGPLLRALLQKPMALTIDESKTANIDKQLPLALLRCWQPQPCGFMSLFHRGQPYAIIVGDHKDWTEERQQQFKLIGKQLSQALKRS